MPDVFVLEAANMICGDVGAGSTPGGSTHLTLARMKLPNMQENYVDFLPGGSDIAIEVNTHVNRLESTFILNGWQPDVMGLFGSNNPFMQSFTAYGLIRERASSAPCQAIAHMHGRLGQANPSEYRRGDLQTWEYAIRSITYYKLMMSMAAGSQPVTLFEFDFFNSVWNVRDPYGNLTPVNAEMLNALGVGAVPVAANYG